MLKWMILFAMVVLIACILNPAHYPAQSFLKTATKAVVWLFVLRLFTNAMREPA